MLSRAKHLNLRAGFTLLELLLVIAIIAVLAGIILFALNPAQRLQEANEAKAASNAQDLQKALNTYVLDNAGQYPTSLQTLFTAGHTRVDICRTGQTCDGIDITSDLVAGGYLGSIPVSPRYSTATDTGYDVVYSNSGVRVIESPAFLLRDDFITAESAPLTSPRTAEPGPGSLQIPDTNGIVSIQNGRLVRSGTQLTLWSDPRIVSTSSFNRQSGRALVVKVTQDSWNQMMIGWTSSNTGGFATTLHGIYPNGSPNLRYRLIGSPPDMVVATDNTLGVENQYSLVLRSSGVFYFRENKLLWVDNTSSTTPLYVHAVSDISNFKLDNFRVVDLPVPFDTDYGLATERKTGNVAQGSTFNHEKDFVMEYTVTTLPTTAHQIGFRTQDGSNEWFVRHGSTGDLSLYERVGGTSTIRINAAGVLSNGHRVVVIVDGNVIRLYSNNVLRGTYSSANNFINNTSGRIAVLSDGAVSDLITWPRNLSGEAAEILENASI